MPNTVKELQETIERDRELVRGWEEEIEKWEEDKFVFEALKIEAKKKLEEGTISGERYLEVVKNYGEVEKQMREIQNNLSDKMSRIAENTKKLEEQMGMESILEVASLKTVEKKFQFRLYDNDNYIDYFDDKLEACVVKITFWQIKYKPTGENIWIPKFVDVFGSAGNSYSIAPALCRVAVRGTGEKVAASIDITIKIGGQPKTTKTTLSIGAEKKHGAEAKVEVPGFGEVGASNESSFSLNYSKSVSLAYSGGEVTYPISLDYDCHGSAPTTRKKEVTPPTEEQLSVISADSEQNFDGDFDFYIKVEEDSL